MNAFLTSRLLDLAKAAVCTICICIVVTAHALTTGASLPVSASVPVACSASVDSAMAFGTLSTTPGLLISQADAVGSITVTCRNGASYSVTAGDGNNYSSGWRMANGSSQYLTYGLYTDTGRATAFPRTGTTLAGTGTGSAQTVNVYGRVQSQTAGGLGSFTDSVTFTVTY